MNGRTSWLICIFGTMLATGISPILSVALMSLHWMDGKNTFHIARAMVDAKGGQELSPGFLSLIAQVSSGIVMIPFNAIILKLQGNTDLSAGFR